MDQTEVRPARRTNSVYAPLGPRQTRRVWIRQEKGFHYFELEVISIDSDHSGDDYTQNEGYVAVSYTWGTLDTVGASIKGLDGHFYPIYITKSLLVFCEYALRALKGYLPMWIDQLCIDQSNHDEKISQIRMMRDIYEASRFGLIWLGPPDIGSSIAMQRIYQIKMAFRKLAIDKENWEADDGRIYPAFLPTLVGPSTEENFREWRAMLNLLDRPWFSRVWIIQEATSKTVFSQETYVLCGEDLVLFDNFMHLWRLIANIEPWYWHSAFTDFAVKAGHQSHAHFNVIGTFWMHRQMYTMFPLLYLLDQVRWFNCTDLHDKVYAIAPFATDVHSVENPLRMDYRTPIEQTYIDFVTWYVREYNNLDFLGSLQKTTNEEKDTPARLPGWVPDWRETQGRTPYSYHEQTQREDHRIPMYTACGKDRVSSLSIVGDVGDANSLQALTVSGVRLTTITSWTPRIEDCDTFGRAAAHMICPLNQVPISHVLSRTLCVDLTTLVIDRRPAVKRGAFYQPWQKCEKGHEECFLSFKGIPNLALNPKTANQGRQFFMLQPVEGQDHGVMGLGEQGLQDNDELWMLDGGKMLYILRPWALSDDYPIRVLDVTGATNSPEAHTFRQGTTMYHLVGEAFVLGLVDGEVLDLLGDEPKRVRPTCLAGMDREYRKISIMDKGMLYSSGETEQYAYVTAENVAAKNEMHLVQVRLGLADNGVNIREYVDKRRYWNPAVLEEMDRGEEESVPKSRPSDQWAPFLTCDVD